MSNNIESDLYIRSANNSKRAQESQRLYSETYANLNSMSLSIMEDTPSSGATPMNEQPSWQWLIHLVEVVLVNNVIVSFLTRISGSRMELRYIPSLFAMHGAKLIVIDKSELSSVN